MHPQNYAATAADFWRDPPWSPGDTGYRMALRPLQDWVWHPIGAAQRSHKIALLHERPHDVLAASETIDEVQSTLRELMAVDARALAEAAAVVEGAATITERVELRQLLGLTACALSINEDLLVLRRDANDTYRLVAACLCSPSYWRLGEKLGRPMQQIHRPVPGLNASLGTRIDDFMRRLPADRIFERRNWFLHENNTLFHPDDEAPRGAPVDALWLRTETQSLRRLSPDEILFTVRIDCWPLAGCREVPGAAAGLADALEALDGDQQAGTEITPRIDAVCAYLRAKH